MQSSECVWTFCAFCFFPVKLLVVQCAADDAMVKIAFYWVHFVSVCLVGVTHMVVFPLICWLLYAWLGFWCVDLLIDWARLSWNHFFGADVYVGPCGAMRHHLTRPYFSSILMGYGLHFPFYGFILLIVEFGWGAFIMVDFHLSWLVCWLSTVEELYCLINKRHKG